jgi:hypothetical protein
MGERERRILVAAVAIAAVFTVVAVVVNVAWPRHASRASGRALWLFGFQTVRVDPNDLSHRQTFSFKGFGQVMGNAGDVYMYDSLAGRLGMIDGHTNHVVELAHLPTNFPRAIVEPAPSIAVARGRLWLVVGPERVRSYDIAAHRLGAEIALPATTAGGATRIVVAAGVPVAVYRDGDATVVARLDTSRLASHRVVETVPPSDVVTASADGPTVWVIGANHATALDATTLSPRENVDLGRAVPGGIGTGLGAGGKLWVVAQARPELDRIDPQTGQVTARVEYLPIPRGYRPPTQLVASATDLWMLAPTSAQTDHHEGEVIQVGLIDARKKATILTTDALFVGGIALS